MPFRKFIRAIVMGAVLLLFALVFPSSVDTRKGGSHGPKTVASQKGFPDSRKLAFLKTANRSETGVWPPKWFLQADSLADGFNDVVALDTLTAWAVGGINNRPVVFHTTNGGLNWEKQSATSVSNWIAYGVSFSDPRHGWVVGSRFFYLKTSDGGQTWQEPDFPARFNPTGVRFVDSLTGWIIGTSDTVLHTTDGGISWSKNVVGSYRGQLLDLNFISHTYGWIVGGDASPNSSPLILNTTDGGNTWQRYLTNNTMRMYYAVDVLDSFHIWCSALFGSFSFSENGGQNWADLALPGAGNNTYRGINFINSMEGWGVGDGGFLQGEIIHTTDGGFSWSYQVQDTLFPLDRITMVDGTHGWAVGAGGTIWKYYGTLMLGDLNLDGQITAADIVLELNRVFLGAPLPAPGETGDVNCDNLFTPSDVVLLLNRTYLGTPFPCNK